MAFYRNVNHLGVRVVCARRMVGVAIQRHAYRSRLQGFVTMFNTQTILLALCILILAGAFVLLWGLAQHRRTQDKIRLVNEIETWKRREENKT